MAVRRVQMMQTGRSDVPLPPAPPPHPGYAPNAALHAIKRHAQEFISPKENEVWRRTKEMSSILADHSTLVYEPKRGAKGGVAGSQPMSTAVHMVPK